MALTQQSSNNMFNAKKFYSLTLNGDIPEALQLLSSEQSLMNENELKIKNEFEKRFAGAEDESDFLIQKNSGINDLLLIYRDYWRRSFISGRNNDTVLKKELTYLFRNLYSSNEEAESTFEDDTLDIFLKRYVNENGLKTTGFGKTGKFYDLLVWKDEQDTVYEFDLNGRKISPRVVFMTGFVTLGWEEYATLGRHYPGGWATKEALFCVKEAYDLNSENFLVSYLAHEGQHFEDYKLFPKLSGTDLEYRAKLVELSMASESLLKTLTFFINNADYESDNAHSIANYCVIRDLSKVIFETEFVSDSEKWSALSLKNINEASLNLLEKNTEDLMNAGSEVVNFIKSK
ncbi:MAG: hypothetical protein WBC65_15840 [Ignavibacteria bacterium]